MYVATVKLSGTWERKDTLKGDMTYMRQHAWGTHKQDRAERYGVDLTSLKFRAKQEKGTRDKRGTFSVQVDVPCAFWMSAGGTTDQQLISRAKQLLRWFMSDSTCRPPKVTVTDAKVLF